MIGAPLGPIGAVAQLTLGIAGGRREIVVAIPDASKIRQWSSPDYTIVPMDVLVNDRYQHFRLMTRRDFGVEGDKQKFLVDKFRDQNDRGVYVKPIFGDWMGVHLIVRDSVRGDTDLMGVVAFHPVSGMYHDIPKEGEQRRQPQGGSDAGYAVASSTGRSEVERYVASVEKINVGIGEKVAKAVSFPLISRVTAKIPPQDGIEEEVKQLLLSMGPDVSVRIVGKVRKTVLATGVNPVVAVLMNDMSVGLSRGAVYFVSGVPAQVKQARAELMKVMPISEWRALMMRDAAQQLPRRWGLLDNVGVEAAPQMQSPTKGGKGKGKGAEGQAPSPDKAQNAAMASAAASPDRADILLGKAVNAVVEKAKSFGGLSDQQYLDLDR
eukprot:gene14477-2075_t